MPHSNLCDYCVTLQLCTVQYSTVQYSTVQYSTVQYSTVQYSTVQYSTVQYSTVQYSTVQLSCVIWCKTHFMSYKIQLWRNLFRFNIDWHELFIGYSTIVCPAPPPDPPPLLPLTPLLSSPCSSSSYSGSPICPVSLLRPPAYWPMGGGLAATPGCPSGRNAPQAKRE